MRIFFYFLIYSIEKTIKSMISLFRISKFNSKFLKIISTVIVIFSIHIFIKILLFFFIFQIVMFICLLLAHEIIIHIEKHKTSSISKSITEFHLIFKHLIYDVFYINKILLLVVLLRILILLLLILILILLLVVKFWSLLWA